MVFVKFREVEPDKAIITLVHHNPSVLSDEIKATGILVESLPSKPEPIQGKTVRPYINPTTKEIWYEYEYRQLSPEEKTKALQDQLDALALEILKLKGLV